MSGRLKEIHDAGINRSAERWCPHHAAHRGSLNVPALPAGSRVERNALTHAPGHDPYISSLYQAYATFTRALKSEFDDIDEWVAEVPAPEGSGDEVDLMAAMSGGSDS